MPSARCPCSSHSISTRRARCRRSSRSSRPRPDFLRSGARSVVPCATTTPGLRASPSPSRRWPRSQNRRPPRPGAPVRRAAPKPKARVLATGDNRSMPASLGAILTAMVTPFDASLRVDEDATVALMSHLVTHGSDGLVICGTTGEAATLTDEEHLRVIELAVGEMRGRCTIVAGVGSNDTRHAIHLTERATELGADAMLSVTPYYNRPNRRGIVRHFEEVAKATDRPIVLYNIPSRTGTDMPVDLLAELAQIEHVEAVKQANKASLQLVDGLDVYAGNDDILRPTLELGGA